MSNKPRKKTSSQKSTPKRASRHKRDRAALDQPDEFVQQTSAVAGWAAQNRNGVIAMLAIAVLAWGGLSFYQQQQRKKSEAATDALAKALDTQFAPLTRASDSLPQTKDDDEDDGITRFSAESDRLAAVETMYGEMTKGPPGGPARMASLLRAGVRLRRGNYDGAIADFSSYLAGKSEQPFTERARQGLAMAHEGKKDWSAALAEIGKLPRTSDAEKYAATMSEARIYAAKGDKDKARARYKQVIDKSGMKKLIEQASKRVAVLDLNLPAAPQNSAAAKTESAAKKKTADSESKK